jgi:hypothetical protein
MHTCMCVCVYVSECNLHVCMHYISLCALVHTCMYMYVFCSLFSLQAFNNMNLNLEHTHMYLSIILHYIQNLSIAGRSVFGNR